MEDGSVVTRCWQFSELAWRTAAFEDVASALGEPHSEAITPAGSVEAAREALEACGRVQI